MARWVFEPGHTAAEFSVCHMMVTWVRGHFKNVHGTLDFDLENPAGLALQATLQAKELWTGETQRDDHLRSADFLDVAHHPTITFRSTHAERTGCNHYKVSGELSVRDVTRPVILDMEYQGTWKTPYNQGRVTRVGFTGTTRINRQDFRVSWNSAMENGGIVVADEVLITLDVEAILET
jgi:polyisoprenoid-binding protein YceI